MSSQYLIDANVLIEAANTYYAFDNVPGFWTWLADQWSAGTVRTVSLVEEEIEHPTQLKEWVGERADEGLFVDVSAAEIQAEFRTLAGWVIAQPFGPEHVTKFLDGADLWIIAVARVTGAVVVTQEQLAGDGTRKIKIPNVCSTHGVRCINTFEMLKELDARF